MAIYRCEVKAVQRSKGRSSTAAAAYRAGEQITDERTGEVHDYTRKQGVAETGLTMPEGEGWNPTRAELWNEAEASEKRKDGTPAREHIIALPHELDDGQRSELVKGYAQDLSNRHGCAVDYAIHDPAEKGDDRNHHAHILRTTRKVDGEGLGEKCAVEKAGRNRREDLQNERRIWEQHCNQALEKAGREERVDHRSHQERGDGLEPEPKQGPTATAMERRGEQSERGDERRQTKRDNWRRREIGDDMKQADQQADRARTEHQHAQEANYERLRRTARGHGIEPVNDQTGSKPGQRSDIERRTGPRVEALGPDSGTQRGRRGDATRAGDALPNVRRGGNRGDGERPGGDLLSGVDARHRRGEGEKMQSPQDTGSGNGLAAALGQGAKQAGGKLKGQPAKGKAKQGQQAQEAESQFKKLSQQLGQFAQGIMGAIKPKGGEQPKKPGQPASQKAQPAQPTRLAPTPRPQQAAPESPTPGATAAKPEARPEPKPEARKPSADYAAKVLEIDAKTAAKTGKTDSNSSLHRYAYAGKKAQTPGEMASFEKGLSQRSQALGQRAAAGDPAALGDLKAAAGRLAKIDPLELANAERNFDKRSGLQGVELSADRLNKASAGDLPGLDKSLASKPAAGSTVADQAKQIGDALPTKKGPQNIMKGPKG